MKNYIKENKKAWEEAFDHSSIEYKEETINILKENPREMFSKELDRLLNYYAKETHQLAQFCCNNGRETIASLHYGFDRAVGFDIAGNMVNFANKLAGELKLNASFIETNILEIDSSFHQTFDIGLITVGALPWFKDLDELFASVSKTLKKDAILIIEDIHPVANMLAAKSEGNYLASYPTLIVNDYFKKTPWVEVSGMGYMTGNTYESKEFTSYTHPMMNIINGLVKNGFDIISLEENNTDQSNMFKEIDGQIVPLTFVLSAKKNGN